MPSVEATHPLPHWRSPSGNKTTHPRQVGHPEDGSQKRPVRVVLHGRLLAWALGGVAVVAAAIATAVATTAAAAIRPAPAAAAAAVPTTAAAAAATVAAALVQAAATGVVVAVVHVFCVRAMPRR